MLIEAIVKSNCQWLLFVIDNQTRAIASMVEASEYICAGRDVVLVVKDVDKGTQIASDTIGITQAKDLNRGRAYLVDVGMNTLYTIYLCIYS